MKEKTIAIAAVLAATMLTAVFATTPLAYAEDDGVSSETETEVEQKEIAVASGDARASNCGVIIGTIELSPGATTCDNGEEE